MLLLNLNFKDFKFSDIENPPTVNLINIRTILRFYDYPLLNNINERIAKIEIEILEI